MVRRGGARYRLCAAGAEDPRCSASVRVTNAVDHLRYFGSTAALEAYARCYRDELRCPFCGAFLNSTSAGALRAAPGTPVPAGLADLVRLGAEADAAAPAPAAAGLANESFPRAQAAPVPLGVADLPHPRNLDHALVRALAAYPVAAHCDAAALEGWACGAACERLADSATEARVAAEPAGRAAALVALHRGHHLVVAFRASLPRSLREAADDFQLLAAPALCDGCRAQRGLYAQYLALRPALLEALRDATARHPLAPLVLAGWGVGGALAAYAAADLARLRAWPLAMVLTLGAPRAGDAALAAHFAAVPALRAVTWRVVHYEDAVSHVPPMDLGWRHVGTEVWYDRAFEAFRVCAPGAEEDPACSLRKPGFKLNDDHFTYFGQDQLAAGAACGALHEYRDSIRLYLPQLVEAMRMFVPMLPSAVETIHGA